MSENDSRLVRVARWMTYLLIALNLMVAIHKYRLSGWHESIFDQKFALSLTGIRKGLWWQFLTYQFLHGGWLHLAMNLLFLDSVGPVLETTMGRWRFLVLYLTSGALGGLVHLLGAAISPKFFGNPVVGASAGLCGLLAALGVIYADSRIPVRLLFIIPMVVRAKFLLLAAVLISVAGIFLPFGRIAHLAHLGGLIGGIWCVNWLKPKELLDIGVPDSATNAPGRPS